MKTITVNNRIQELPEDRSVKNIVRLYSDIGENDAYFVKLNGKILNSIIDGEDTQICEGDVLEVFPLIIGG